ncbi:MAG TPA: hypothetical protein IAB49_03140 [Candidatus Caccenecus avistercoris]|nr:hypothetical protein [Candidatus Caccenecus avistercoris]
MKKLIIIFTISFIVILVFTCVTAFLLNNDSSSISQDNVQYTHDKDEDLNDLKSEDIEQSNDEKVEQSSDTQENEISNENDIQEDVKNENISEEQTLTEKEEPIKDSEDTQNEIQNDDTPVLSVCSNSDSEYLSFLSQYQKNNPTHYVVNSFEEAKSFGEKAMYEYGYGYEQNSLPVIFTGTNCTKEIWYVRIWVSSGECSIDGTYNSKMWLSSSDMDNMVDVFDFLRSKGYDCGTKHWIY